MWGCRPVSESESERQRARNGASESERDFSREWQYIRESQSERNLEWDMTLSFYSTLQWSSDVCGIYKLQHIREPSLSPVSLVQHQHSTSMHGLFLQGYPLSLPSRLVLLGIVLAWCIHESNRTKRANRLRRSPQTITTATISTTTATINFNFCIKRNLLVSLCSPKVNFVLNTTTTMLLMLQLLLLLLLLRLLLLLQLLLQWLSLILIFA